GSACDPVGGCGCRSTPEPDTSTFRAHPLLCRTGELYPPLRGASRFYPSSPVTFFRSLPDCLSLSAVLECRRLSSQPLLSGGTSHVIAFASSIPWPVRGCRGSAGCHGHVRRCRRQGGRLPAQAEKRRRPGNPRADGHQDIAFGHGHRVHGGETLVEPGEAW